MFTSETDIATVRNLLSTGHLPDESYIYYVCDFERCDIVQALCDYNIFRKILPEETYEQFMALYASKRSVADILLENGCITQETYDSYCWMWSGLGM